LIGKRIKDMNTTTLNMTTLDGGNVIIKKGGGGGSTPTPPSGGSDWHYFDVSGFEGIEKTSIIQLAMMLKVKGETIESELGVACIIAPTGFEYLLSVKNEVKAIGVDYSIEIRMGEQSATVGSSIIAAPWYGQVPEITKEQFYSLD
jgi:hypothetical protein